jgi:hypothetical protein
MQGMRGIEGVPNWCEKAGEKQKQGKINGGAENPHPSQKPKPGKMRHPKP